MQAQCASPSSTTRVQIGQVVILLSYFMAYILIAQFEKAHGSNQHDHIVLTDTGELLEFCDPRIQNIKSTIEDIFDIEIQHHSLYFYGVKKGTKKD